jgi:hypothetical protein
MNLFEELLHAEEEDQVTTVLENSSLLAAEVWEPLGATENNFSQIGNQHGEPGGAMADKLINSIDAHLLLACYRHGIDAESDDAPKSMAEAVERFFGVKGGLLGELSSTDQTKLALGIRLVAVGSNKDPSYLVIDSGEGQTPRSFPDTFMSLNRSNKMRIPFVQGKYNAGGTGVLQFCGRENYQLIVSRRQPDAPSDPDDSTRDLWGYTLVRRNRPKTGDKRRSSVWEYLAPDGMVPTFAAPSILVVPKDRAPKPAEPYAEPLEYGTAIKLYSYQWSARSLATRDARFELEKYLHAPCLPVRVTETRGWFKANYFSTTVSGIWAPITADELREDRQQVESGFPASATVNLPSTGELPYSIVVFKPEKASKRTPHGLFFTVNGQVHGQAPADFVSRRLGFDYLAGELFVSIDCTNMNSEVREDFFMASRDRVRRNQVYDQLLAALQADLKAHPGLRALNTARRAQEIERGIDKNEEVITTLQQLIKLDPSLRSLFEVGDRLVTTVGPTEVETFKGQRFPAYFRIAKQPTGLKKMCPVNRTCRVEFETDAANDYFTRSESPGKIQIVPAEVCEHQQLWNGIFSTRWRPPEGSKPGDRVAVTVAVTDPDRESRGKPPFWCEFEILFGNPEEDRVTPGRPRKPRKPKAPNGHQQEAPGLAMPTINELRRDEWEARGYPEMGAFRVMSDGEGGYDFFVNVDSTYLLNELIRLPSEADKKLARYWFRWGLYLCAMGMMQHLKRIHASPNGSKLDGDAVIDLEMVNQSVDGVAAVIVPIIRTLNRAADKA